MTHRTSSPSRSAVLGAIVSVSALTVPAVAIAATPTDGDAEIIALSQEIHRIKGSADDVAEKGIDPLNETFEQILREGPEGVTNESFAAAFAFSREVGREAAIEEQQALDSQNDRLFERMMSIPATTQPARAAKVRALLIHVMGDAGRRSAEDVDAWDKEMMRKLLGEFAGMTEDELAAI